MKRIPSNSLPPEMLAAAQEPNSSKPKTPNPGSDEAIELGCICPVMDNHHGRGSRGDNNLFWVTSNCPIHTTTHPGDGKRRCDKARS